MKLMFLDESGDHNLTSIKSDYSVFVLGGVIIDRAYALSVVEERMRSLKREFFGRDDIILHTAEMIRWKNDFAFMKHDEDVKGKFIAAISAMMAELDYQVIACAIDKPAYAAKYGTDADIYRYSLNMLVERFCYEIGNVPDGGLIYAETRRPDLDHALNMAWEGIIKRDGLRYARAKKINSRIIDLVLKDKRTNIAGTQLADLVVSPVGRKLLGKPDREDWRIVESKFRRRPGNSDYMGSGLIVLPKTDA
ncbi:MAG TPA: DUF3800 domain-containing protein [Thermomicrobiales bacterium]|nr:DUF3800 domain-containing protein [Thermomicrobiales bacterium]